MTDRDLTMRIDGGDAELLVTRRPGSGPSVLYVHGATFPSALSVAYRIDGRSWMDDLQARGFDVWAFDFAGYGGSGRPAALLDEAPDGPPYGRAEAAAGQIERVARALLAATGRPRFSVIAHSWGSMPAGVFAARCPELVDRMALFGAIAQRDGTVVAPVGGAHQRVTADDQWHGFQSGLPGGTPSLIAPDLFVAWAREYLASDTAGAHLRVPAGPQHDIANAWSGRLAYDPAAIRSPTLLVRGEWDDVSSADDARWLARSLGAVSRDVTLPRGGHRMHLEDNRQALFAAVGDFLAAPA